MTRETLPNRRHGEVFIFEHDEISYRANVSRFADGRLAEIFLNGEEKPNTAVAVIGHDLAVTASLALQHGCPVKTLRRALSCLSSGAAAGPLGRLLDLAEEGQQ
jgi:ribonucleoside-diphosphate reductase alpha chain